MFGTLQTKKDVAFDWRRNFQFKNIPLKTKSKTSQRILSGILKEYFEEFSEIDQRNDLSEFSRE